MKKLLTILLLIMLIISFFQITSMYALYKEQLQSQYDTLLGIWAITVNGTDLSSGGQNLTFSIADGQLTYIEDSHTAADRIAPGTQAYFDLVIDPTNTDVSIIYKIEVGSDDTSNANIELLSIDNYFQKDGEDGEKVTTTNETIFKDGNLYTGVIPISVIRDGYKNYIRLYFEWTNIEDNNVSDSTLAGTDGAKLSIPVDINLKQYITGEGLGDGS